MCASVRPPADQTPERETPGFKSPADSPAGSLGLRDSGSAAFKLERPSHGVYPPPRYLDALRAELRAAVAALDALAAADPDPDRTTDAGPAAADSDIAVS
jgi:hypothetical protein